MVLSTSPQIVSDAYHQPVRIALAIQIPICIVSLLMLDGGALSKICGCAMLGYWLGVSLIWMRRPFAPHSSDLRYIRYAFPLAFVAAFAMGQVTLAWLGN